MARLLTRTQGRLSDEAPPPNPLDPGEGGGGGDWALLTPAPNQVLAFLIRGRLVQEGIDVVLDDHNPSPGAWLHPFGDPASPVRIFVKRIDLTAASLTLHDVENLAEPPLEASPDGPGSAEAGIAGAAGATSGAELRHPSLSGRPGFPGPRWLRHLVRVVMALVAAAAIAGLLVFGPCVSHWFCV
ncbi:MAG: hypothetical protein NVSMB32_17230 [Actinomycetota bacterium]